MPWMVRQGARGSSPLRRRRAPVSLHLPDHARRVEPGLLAGDEAVADVEHVKDAETDRRPAALDADELATDVTRGDRFVDDMVAAGESREGLQVQVGDRVDDSLVDLARGRLAEDGAEGVADVVPDEIVRVGRERALDVVRVLGGEVPVDDVHASLPVDA